MISLETKCSLCLNHTFQVLSNLRDQIGVRRKKRDGGQFPRGHRSPLHGHGRDSTTGGGFGSVPSGRNRTKPALSVVGYISVQSIRSNPKLSLW